jgi:putative oxidoreductase
MIKTFLSTKDSPALLIIRLALGIGTIITICMLKYHIPNGFFMNWYGQQKGEGFEYHLLVIGIALALLIQGGGKWSLDRALAGE